MSRIAWFTPLPPQSSGVAQYSAELLPALSQQLDIEVFVDGPAHAFERPGGIIVSSAHDFVWQHAQRPYDLVVYQLGNAPCHDYMWAYLVRHPGLVVLHDGQFHHARALSLRRQKRYDDYVREFMFDQPDVAPELTELGVAGLLGSLAYLWPMRRTIVEASRYLMTHNERLAADIRAEHPGARVDVVEMGVPASLPHPGASEAVRLRHQIPADAVLVTAFGRVTPEKRISQALRAVASVSNTVPNVHLLLVGETVDYFDVRKEAQELHVADRVTVAGFVSADAVDDYLAASDICLSLRWPTSRETSAAWLRCLAAGRPTVITELAHTADVAALDPRDWSVLFAPREPSDDDGQPAEPVCVSVDLLDEDHSLALALRRLATDVRLRAALGEEARRLWNRRFRLERMIAGYRRVIDAACVSAPPDPARRSHLPRHFFANGSEATVRMLRQLAVPEERIAALWTGSADL